jgi:hypothetical protein
VEDKNKTTQEVAEVSAETLDKLSSPDADIRQSGLIDVFKQHLPAILADYVFKRRDRKFVEDALQAAFDLTGGTPSLIKWGHENYHEFIKLWARMLPEAQKAQSGPAVVQIIHGVPPSPLDLGDIVDMDDLDDE